LLVHVHDVCLGKGNHRTYFHSGASVPLTRRIP
jgi:hypothetical protein